MNSYRKKIKNPNYFKKDEIFDDYITHNNKKFDLHLVRCKFEVKIINYTDFIETEYFFNTSIVNMKKYSLYHVYHVIYRGRKFSHISKMKFKSILIVRYMNYKYYLKQPMQMIDRRLIMIIVKNPQILNSLNRDVDHPLIRKHIHIPFDN